MSAIRNLNNHEIMGRHLRVDYAENESRLTGRGDKSSTQNPAAAASMTSAHVLQQTSPEAINNMLEGMSHQQLYDIVAKVKVKKYHLFFLKKKNK